MDTYYIETYGCQMNLSDSEALAGILEQMGYRQAESVSQADLILLNTCTVREKAAERIMGRAGQLGRLKKKRPHLVLGVCGCVPEQRGMVDRLLKRAPAVDLLFGPHHISHLGEMVRRVREGESPVVETGRESGGTEEGLPRVRTAGASAWVTIMRGCTNFCSYCIVPFTRGPEESRRQEAVVAEVRELVKAGYLEVTLLGQNVNVYGRDLDDGTSFTSLLQELNGIEDLLRIRYTTSHPRDFTTGMVDSLSGLKRVCEHFHLPVQSGSDRILELMRRGYGREHYLELARHIRRTVPGATITTDIIVGFPGETNSDFEDTLDLCRQVEFDGAFTFIYSPRTGTRAAHLEGAVDPDTSRDRLQRLMDLLYPIHLSRNKALVGSVVEILIEGQSPRDPTILTGRTRGNRIVLVPGDDPRHRLAGARIVEAGTWTLKGELEKGEEQS